MIRVRLDGALAQIATAFDRSGVDALLLKGPAFARWLYDDPSERAYGDIDLLVDPAARDRAREALAELGFAPILQDALQHEQAHHHESWRRLRPAMTVELHSTLALLTVPSKTVWRLFRAGATSIVIGGVAVPIPAQEVQTLIVAVHAAQHGPAGERALEDLRRALQRVDAATWRRAAELAEELDATAAFALGLGLLPEGCERADALQLPQAAASRYARLLATSPPPTTLGIEQLVTAGSWAQRLRIVRYKLFPTASFMRAWYPPPIGGPAGLLAAHLMRWRMLARSLPGGLRVWHRTTRSSRRDTGS